MDSKKVTRYEYIDLTEGKLIMGIGGWGNSPHHALPRVERVRRRKPSKVTDIQPTEQIDIDCTQTEKQRSCECGEPLEFRQRCCDKCKVRRRRKSNREAQRKHTKKKRST